MHCNIFNGLPLCEVIVPQIKTNRPELSMQLIYSMALTFVMLTAAPGFEHKEHNIADQYSWVDVLPFDMLIQVSSLEDDRPIIDRLTLDMIGEIPLEGELISFEKQ